MPSYSTGLAVASTWKGETTYTSGMLIQPTNPNGHTYICTNGGTSGKTEPIWPEVEKDVITEAGSTLTWQENGTLQYQQYPSSFANAVWKSASGRAGARRWMMMSTASMFGGW